jgi:TrmH family RNA methyltransferase
VATKAALSAVKKLHQKKYRDDAGLFLVEGRKSVEEAVKSNAPIQSVFVHSGIIALIPFLGALKNKNVPVYEVSSKELESISDTETSQGIIATVSYQDHTALEKSLLQKKELLVVCLEDISDPGNLGTMIRTCDWFGVDAVVLSKNTVDLYNSKVVRSTMGSLFHIPVLQDVDLPVFIRTAQKNKCSVYSAELSHSVDFRSVKAEKKSLLLIGSEAHGISKGLSALADYHIRIPGFGNAESLNAAVASGILISYFKQQA